MTSNFSINLNSLLHHCTFERELEECTEDSDLEAMRCGNEADAKVGPAPMRVVS